MWSLNSETRLQKWKRFREDISTMPLEQAPEATIEFWSRAPFTPYYLDNDDTANWPDPWTLIHENYYCDVAKTLGIIYTLMLSGHGTSLEPELRVYYDPGKRYFYNLACFNQGKYILNMHEQDIVNNEQLPQELELKYSYTAETLNLE
jgi:hypothetical protein